MIDRTPVAGLGPPVSVAVARNVTRSGPRRPVTSVGVTLRPVRTGSPLSVDQQSLTGTGPAADVPLAVAWPGGALPRQVASSPRTATATARRARAVACGRSGWSADMASAPEVWPVSDALRVPV